MLPTRGVQTESVFSAFYANLNEKKAEVAILRTEKQTLKQRQLYKYKMIK